MTVRATLKPLPGRVRESAVNKLEPPEKDEPNYSAYVSSEELPFCCSVTVLGHADGDDGNTEYGHEEGLPEEFADAMAEAVEAEIGGDTGLALYTLTDNQVGEAAGLEQAGFQVIAEFVSPSSKNRIRLFAKLCNQPRNSRR